MSSASQILFGSIQGESYLSPPPTLPDLSELIIEDSPVFYWQIYDGSVGGGVGEPDASGNGFNANQASYTPVTKIRDGLATGAGFIDRDVAGTRVLRDQGLSPIIPPISEKQNWSFEIILRTPVPTDINNVGAVFGEIHDGTNFYWSGGIYIDDRPTSTDAQIRGITRISNTDYVVSGGQLQNETSYHIVVTRSVETLSIYVNGVLASSRNDLPALDSEPREDNYPVVGSFDLSNLTKSTITVCDAAAYTYALSSERVEDHYLSAKLI